MIVTGSNKSHIYFISVCVTVQCVIAMPCKPKGWHARPGNRAAEMSSCSSFNRPEEEAGVLCMGWLV